MFPGPRRDVPGRRRFQPSRRHDVRARGLDPGRPEENSRDRLAPGRASASRSTRNAGEVALVEALERAGRPGEDAGEPSWAVLGSLIRETRFVHVQHRLDFMTHWWHVPVEEFWDEARPLVARHRFQPYLLTMAIGTPQADRAFADSFDPSWLPDLEYAEEPMLKQARPGRRGEAPAGLEPRPVAYGSSRARFRHSK